MWVVQDEAIDIRKVFDGCCVRMPFDGSHTALDVAKTDKGDPQLLRQYTARLLITPYDVDRGFDSVDFGVILSSSCITCVHL